METQGKNQRIASYDDVRRKGAEIYRSGGVEPYAIGATFSEAHVTSTTGRAYKNLLSFASGDSSKVDDWACECPWSKWNYQRSQKYKHLEHRKCSHTLAHLYYLMAFRQVMPKN